MASIHTLNCRGYVLLPVAHKLFERTDEQAFLEIQQMHDELIAMLDSKGIDYTKLRTALTPQQSKHEAAFLFNTEQCENTSMPGVGCVEQVLSTLNKKKSYSLLAGNIIDHEDKFCTKLLQQYSVLDKPLTFSHSGSCYVVYVNNLSITESNSIHTSLSSFKSYFGYLPCTFNTIEKTLVAMNLPNLFLIHGGTVIVGHEHGLPGDEDHIEDPVDFVAAGYDVISVDEIYYDQFLTYKPELILLDEQDGDDDLAFALRAISSETRPLSEFDIHIDDRKFHEYLQTKKLRKLKKAEIAELTKPELEDLIRKKIRTNYFYDLNWLVKPECKVSLFAIMLEFDKEGVAPERAVVAFEYKVDEKLLTLTTIT